MSISVLKTISKELLGLVRQDNLSPATIIAALDLLAPHPIPPPKKTLSTLVCDIDNPYCVLPLGSSNTRSYGLTAAGAQQQMIVYSSVVDAVFQNMANNILPDKGVFWMDGCGNNSVWANLYSHAQARKCTQRLRAVNFMRGGQMPPFSHKMSHSVNVLSGLNRTQLKSWIEIMAQAGAQTHPQLDLTGVKSQAAIFADVFWHLSQYFNVFLTFSHMRQWGNIETFAQHFPQTALGQIYKVDFSSWTTLFSAWNAYIAPFCDEWGYVLDQPHPDMHLMQSLHEKDIVLILLPALECSPIEVQLLGNALSATFVQHMNATREMSGVAFIKRAEKIMSPNTARHIAKNTHSWGVVWDSPPTFIAEQRHVARFFMTTDPPHFADWGLPTTLLNPEEGYLVTETERVKLSLFYTAVPQAQTLKLPTLHAAKTPADLSLHRQTNDKREYILQKQLEQKPISLAWCHETVARMYGFNSWHEVIHSHK